MNPLTLISSRSLRLINGTTQAPLGALGGRKPVDADSRRYLLSAECLFYFGRDCRETGSRNTVAETWAARLRAMLPRAWASKGRKRAPLTPASEKENDCSLNGGIIRSPLMVAALYYGRKRCLILDDTERNRLRRIAPTQSDNISVWKERVQTPRCHHSGNNGFLSFLPL